MRHPVLSAGSLVCALVIGSSLWPSCRGKTAAASQLPAPHSDDRPLGSAPERPRVSVVLPRGKTTPMRVLAANDDLQKTIDTAKPGDVIGLEPGVIFSGPFTLPNKNGNEWVTIRTKIPDGVFPSPGTRVNPSHASLMPIIESSSLSALSAAAGAHHYRFIGIQIRPRSGAFLYNLVTLGLNEDSVEALPHHITFERCYVHGDPKVGGRRGIALNSRYTAVVDSYLADFKEQGADSQALAGWNGLGPFAILNNYIEGAGENLLFGGADPSVRNLVPSDIAIVGNRFAKPLAWKIGDPSYAGVPWTVKNLFELKNARRVLVDGNVFEYNWPHAQNGFAILFTPRNQDGSAPWSMVQDVVFSRNIVRHTGSAVNILGTDDNNASQQVKRISIVGNVFEDIGGPKWSGAGRLFQLLSRTADVAIDHNTAFHAGDVIAAEGGPHLGFVCQNNLTPNNQYGVGGAGTYGHPLQTLSTFFPAALFIKNVLVGGMAQQYPPNNFFPATWAEVGFVDFGGGNYRLLRTSPYKNAGTDHKDVGADIDALDAVTTGALRGQLPQEWIGDHSK